MSLAGWLREMLLSGLLASAGHVCAPRATAGGPKRLWPRPRTGSGCRIVYNPFVPSRAILPRQEVACPSQ